MVAAWCTTLAWSSARLVAWDPSCAPARTHGFSSCPALWDSPSTVSFNRRKSLAWKSRGSKLCAAKKLVRLTKQLQHFACRISQRGSQSDCVLSECRLVRGHHADAAVVLVAAPLGILYVANIGAHSDDFNFLQVSHAVQRLAN